ncbi:hypothetical protein SAMN02745165_00017 [Malonomonas rubra DSM 5091]|uniref:DUF2062 domain-containing protein n=1 Tax=Malonomonas rubra DSM 5091 TaxID=1122189 RepID=A0A1M6B2L8_MALRU|nr:DUF2062 domain-containing protein [Malonomonas rubra]SHI42992.1 hypothetical protein SAMN02745165_00017 [Malonomonas rubra DSM 5091]
MTWKRFGFFRQFKLNLIRLIRLRVEPDEIARGMALGLFIGMTPTFGVQMFIALFCAMLLRQNKIAALIGVWNTNPLTAPIIYGMEYEVGRLLLGLPRPTTQIEFTYEAMKELGWMLASPLSLGSLVLGIPVAAIGYALTLHFIPVMRQWRVPRWPRPRRKENITE